MPTGYEAFNSLKIIRNEILEEVNSILNLPNFLNLEADYQAKKYERAINTLIELLQKEFVDGYTDGWHYSEHYKVLKGWHRTLELMKKQRERYEEPLPSDRVTVADFSRGECSACTGTAEPQLNVKGQDGVFCVECARNVTNEEGKVE